MLFCEVVATNDEQHFLGAFGEEHRGLPGGISGAGDDHGRAAAELAFERRRRVINASAFELLAALGLEAAVIGAGGDEHALGASVAGQPSIRSCCAYSAPSWK